MSEQLTPEELVLLAEKDIDELTNEELEQLMPYEIALWAQNGLPQPTGLRMDVQIQVILRVLTDKGYVTEEEMQLTFIRTLYRRHVEIRKEIQSELIKQRVLQGVQIAVPGDMKI